MLVRLSIFHNTLSDLIIRKIGRIPKRLSLVVYIPFKAEKRHTKIAPLILSYPIRIDQTTCTKYLICLSRCSDLPWHSQDAQQRAKEIYKKKRLTLSDRLPPGVLLMRLVEEMVDSTNVKQTRRIMNT